MKDPLQPGRTAYEILGVTENVDNNGIMKAFRLAMPGNRDLQALSEAYNALSNPGQRLLTDLFLYQDGFLAADLPFQLNQDSLIKNRKELAQQIEDVYRTNWWSFRCLHSYALLWFWWAVAREDKNLAAIKGLPKLVCPALPRSVKNWWEPAVMSWTALIAAHDFWQDWSTVKNCELPHDAADRLQSYLLNRLNNYSDEYNKAQAQKDFDRIQKTEELLRNEIGVAKRLAASGVRIKTFEGSFAAVSFGRQTLDWLGMSTLVRDELTRLYRKQPENQNIKALVRDLSAYGELNQQLKNHRFDQVIEQIMSLAENERLSEEAQQILLTAYLEKGSQQAELGQWTAAVATFIQALQNCQSSSQPIIRKKATDLLRPYIAKLQISDKSAADKLLDSAIILLDDAPDLLQKATDLHISQAIALINGVAEVDSGKPELSRNQAIEQVRQGISMLESSAKKGSKRAKENLAKAKVLLNNIEQGLWGVGSSVQSQLSQAIELANKNKYIEAIKIMEKIKVQIPKVEQNRFNIIYAGICNAYGVQLLNEAIEKTRLSAETPADIKVTRDFVKKYLKGSKGQLSFFKFIGFLFKLGVLVWFSYGTYLLIERIPFIEENEAVKLIVLIVLFGSGFSIMIRMFDNLKKNTKKSSSRQKYGWRNPPPCVKRGCKNNAQLEFDLSKYGIKNKVPLCDLHGKEMRKLITPTLEAYAGLVLKLAVEQLKRAKSLNPNNNTIRDNLHTAEDIQNRYK